MNLWNWITTAGHKTHDMIVAPIQHMIDELHDYAAHHATQQLVKNATIDTIKANAEDAVNNLKTEISVHETEAMKAVATATRLRGIIG
jgi:hypothetical protein